MDGEISEEMKKAIADANFEWFMGYPHIVLPSYLG